MQIKKYRAATTREALEKIKSELGEDAFVLETKQVRSNGFLGYGAATQVEVSAASPNQNKKRSDEPVKKSADKPQLSTRSFLGLTDDAPAAPVFSGQVEEKESKEIAYAFAARAGASSVQMIAPKNETFVSGGIEISTEAPRIVHSKKDSPVAPPKKETPAPVAAVQVTETLVAPKTVETARQTLPPQISDELDRLRAEMREIKFSLGSFCSRQTALAAGNDFASDAPPELYDSPFYEAYLELTASGLLPEKAREIIAAMIPAGGNQFANPSELAYCALLKAMPSLVRFGNDPLRSSEQTVVAMIGSTGVGKTTTLAKLAARAALKERRRVELVTLDTYRIAAVEQLKTYAEIIGAGFTVARSVLELDATLARLPKEAVVLIDTTGKSPHDLSDQFDYGDYLREREEILKCLVVTATTHPVDAVAAINKFGMFGANCLAMTKLDETTRAGASLSIAADSRLPLVYLCAGQRVPEDLEPATADAFAAKVLTAQKTPAFA